MKHSLQNNLPSSKLGKFCKHFALGCNTLCCLDTELSLASLVGRMEKASVSSRAVALLSLISGTGNNLMKYCLLLQ